MDWIGEYQYYTKNINILYSVLLVYILISEHVHLLAPTYLLTHKNM